MKQLKNLFKLSGKVAIYVPSTTSINQAIDNTTHVNGALTLLSTAFGGATSTPAIGAWVTKTGDLVKENTTLVYAYCSTDQLNEHINAVLEYCENLKTNLSQEAIAIEINGELYFI